MFGKSIKLFDLFGFTVKLDLSWFIIGALVAWTLARGVFPQMYEGLSPRTYWLMGIGGAVGLLISIVWHELCHSLVARRYGLPMGGITLFIFGGVAEMSREPPNAKAEFLMAIAGPISSVLLGGLLLGLSLFMKTLLQWPDAVTGAISYLGIINVALAVFNMIPGFPLDGGRVLRSIMWYWKGNLRWATRIASQVGAGFGMVLIVFGVISFIGGQLIGGIWYFMIGMFLRSAAHSSYQQLLLRQALGGEQVQHFMTDDPITVTPDMTVSELVNEYIYRYHHKLFPVIDNGALSGCITTQHVKAIPREDWPETSIEDCMDTCSDQNTIAPDADAMDALARMNRTKTSRLVVVDNGKLKGIITLKDLLEFFSLKVELEDSGEFPDKPAKALDKGSGTTKC